MPTDYADYPSNAHILAYIQGFARKFDLIRLAWTARDDWSGFMIS
jgi:hypothetical protein